MYIVINNEHTLHVTGVSFGYDQGIIHLAATLTNDEQFIADMPVNINKVEIFNSQDQLLHTLTVPFSLDQYEYNVRSDDETDENYERLEGYFNLISIPTLIKDDAE